MTMKLGKRFSRYQRRWGAKIRITFTREDGTEIKPHRKLNMMLALSLKGGISMKAVKKEEAKLLAKIDKARQEYKEGKTTTIRTHEELDAFFDAL